MIQGVFVQRKSLQIGGPRGPHHPVFVSSHLSYVLGPYITGGKVTTDQIEYKNNLSTGDIFTNITPIIIMSI